MKSVQNQTYTALKMRHSKRHILLEVSNTFKSANLIMIKSFENAHVVVCKCCAWRLVIKPRSRKASKNGKSIEEVCHDLSDDLSDDLSVCLRNVFVFVYV